MKHASIISNEFVDLKQSYEERNAQIVEANGIVYQLGELLGGNLNNNVHSAVDLVNGNFVAIKQIDISGLTENQISMIEGNIQKLKTIQHQNIVNVLDSFTESSRIIVVMDFIECGSISDMIRVYGPLPEKLVSKYLYQTLNGLIHLHKMGIIHKNIKTSNILIDRYGTVKLSDASMNVGHFVSQLSPFVEKKFLRGLKSSSKSLEGTINNTIEYDIWSLGCSIIEALTGDYPLHVYNSSKTFRINQNYEESIPNELSKELKSIILSLLKTSELRNSSLESIVRKKYFSGMKNRKVKKTTSKKSSKGHLSRNGSKKDIKMTRSGYKTFRVKTSRNFKLDQYNKELDDNFAKLSSLSLDNNHKDVLSFLDSFIDRNLIFQSNRSELVNEEKSYIEIHEFAVLFETQLKKCLKEKQDIVSIATYLQQTLKKLRNEFNHLAKEYDHLKQLLKITNNFASSLSKVNDSVRFTLKRFCDYYCLKYNDINNMKKSSKKIESFIRDTNDILISKDSSKTYPKTLQYKILSQNFYNIGISRWNGHKWKQLNMIVMEVWLIFYKENEDIPYFIIQLPSTLKITDYKSEMISLPKNSCFGLQNEIFSVAKKSEYFSIIEDTYSKYGFNLTIEKKKRND